MERFKNYLRAQGARTMLYTKALGKWLVVSGIAGVLCGLLGSAFHLGVDLANTLRLAHPWLIWLLPAAGLAITGIYAFFSVEGQSTNSIISEVQSGKGLKWNLIPSIFLSTLLTHLVGGSAGREGAALQMGGTIGFEVGLFLGPVRDAARGDRLRHGGHQHRPHLSRGADSLPDRVHHGV